MTDPTDRADQQLDPGAYIGRKPELAAATIPGGVQPDDERVAAGQTQSGHREGDPASDDDVREAGANR